MTAKTIVILFALIIVAIASKVTFSPADASKYDGDDNLPGNSRIVEDTKVTGWRSVYTQILFDDIETLQPSVGSAFALTSVGSITNAPHEVIAGEHSIRGEYTGTDSYSTFLHTDPVVLELTPMQSYSITFDYRILATPDQGFETLFYSPTGGSEGVWLPSITVFGQAGDSGTTTLTNTLADYSDYRAYWNIVGTGSIAIDNIQIVNLTTGQPVVSEDAELIAPGLAAGLIGSANVITDSDQVIAGNASLRLSEGERLELATELIASVDGPADADWDALWLAELDRRLEAERTEEPTSSDWAEARRRILNRLPGS